MTALEDAEKLLKWLDHQLEHLPPYIAAPGRPLPSRWHPILRRRWIDEALKMTAIINRPGVMHPED
jgi:hypothetical protein